MFFDRILDALEQLRSNRAAYLANEARRLRRGALTKVLTKVAFWNPSVDFADALESLPEDTDLTASKSVSSPSSAASTESRGWRASTGTRHPISHRACEFMSKTILS